MIEVTAARETMFSIIAIVLVLAALAFLLARRLTAKRRFERRVAVGQLLRRYIVWVPGRRKKPGRLPVVLAFHPGYATPEGFESNIALHTAAESRNFIIVYPEGYKRSWNAGTCCGPALADNIDERAFIHDILSDLDTFCDIDRSRIYATGHSNGARLCYFLACTMGDEIAAIAPVGGAAGAVLSLAPRWRPTRALPIFHIHGLQDQWAPYEGGPGLAPRVPSEAPVETGIAFWRRLAGADEETRHQIFGGAADCIVYKAVQNGGEIRLCRIPNLGHHWPGTRMTGDYQKMAPILGPTDPSIRLDDVNNEILRFFAAFRSGGTASALVGKPTISRFESGAPIGAGC